MTNRRRKGMIGEDLTASRLEDMGYQIVDRNYYTRYGEIDVIARKEDLLVFIEVKTRFSDRFGDPELSVNARKMKHIREACSLYLQEYFPDWRGDIRIDVVSIRFYPSQCEPEVEWFENAIYE